ncbi:hypothetical protein [Agrobacterium tumefaciens]|uniref:hypothetical protein n=1 Tax=Agrobacterium tumefaciens TaxID=358 RepID=UPI001571C216|nr:hypothetical protein [Agrobacterium tumefaciens]
MADLDARLKAREALEASFESLKAQGIQASLDYIQVNVAPQLANLKTSIDLAQEQIDQIIIGGKAPDTLRFGGELPAYYATAQSLTQGLDGKVPAARKVNGKELSADIELRQGDVGLDKVNNTADADKPVSTPQKEALDKKVGVDTVQNLTPAQRGQALANIGAGALAGDRNLLINPDLLYWQRGLSQNLGGYRSVDGYSAGAVGSTFNFSIQTHAVGQILVPGNPQYFGRMVVNSVAGAGNYVVLEHHIEDVRLLAGETVTFTLWGAADAVKSIGVEFVQFFGTGGSATVMGIGSQQIELSPGFARKSVVVDIPGISGKVIGSTPNSYTGIVLWFDAGANLAARSGGITQKSGTYDISHLSLVRGDARAEFDPSSPRSKAIDLILCQRRYQRLTGSFLGGLGASGANVRRFNIGLPTYMRVPPSIFVGSQSGGEAVVWEDVTPNSVRGYVNMNNNTSEVSIADLRFESEL